MTVRILALSGSLRAASLNSALLRAAARVARLRRELIAADAVVIASPEYAHGVTGVLKNALDWMVGNESFVDKPVAVFNASPRAVHADAALREILSTMSARVVGEACIAVPVLGAGLDEEGIVNHAVMRSLIVGARQALSSAPARRGR